MSIPASYLQPAFACSACGRTHGVNVREVHYGPDALLDLPRLCARFGAGPAIGLVADGRTRAVAGDAARRLLAEAAFVVTETLVPDPLPGVEPACDDRTFAWLREACPPADCYVAVGSGVVNDLVKWLAGERGKPYICIPTAASMNGYASDNVAPTVRGVKCLERGRGPVAILATPQALLDAPWRMTAAGLGDVIAKPVSSADWRLNNLVFGETFCPFCVEAIREAEAHYLGCPEALRQGAPQAMEALFDALILTGLAMSMMGTSAPASGGEHLISHSLDMLALRDGGRHDLHGRQVGVATILCAALYAEVLALPELVLIPPEPAGVDAEFWGALTPEVEKQWAKKQAKCAVAGARFRDTPGLWPEVRAVLQPMLRSPQAIKDCLRRAGAAHTLGDIGVSRERFLAVVSHAAEIRERFTILDLARLVGVLPGRAAALVDTWLVA